MTTTPPVVLVNGAWHGGWCWSLLELELAARGVESTTVEVLGLGGLSGASPTARHRRPFDPEAFATERSRVADLTLEQVTQQFINDVRTTARGRCVSVVAHSVSGLVVAAALENAPQLFHSVIYLAAVVPLTGLPAAAYNAEPEMSTSLLMGGLVGDPKTIGAARCDFQGNAQRTVDTFYHDVPDGYRQQAVTMLAADVPYGINGAVDVTAGGLASVPRAYIHTTQDRAVPLAMQQRIVREINRVCGGSMPVRSLASSHSPFLSQPARLADHLLDLL